MKTLFLLNSLSWIRKPFPKWFLEYLLAWPDIDNTGITIANHLDGQVSGLEYMSWT